MRRIAVVLVAAIGIAALAIWAKGCLDIDRCLDRGGSWNYELDECEH